MQTDGQEPYILGYIDTGGTMAVTSIDIDQNELKQARELTGAGSNRETVDLALRTLIAVRRQPAAVERIISRRFEPDQLDAATITPDAHIGL
jgi:Arc/MetJ family transcription regulator